MVEFCICGHYHSLVLIFELLQDGAALCLASHMKSCPIVRKIVANVGFVSIHLLSEHLQALLPFHSLPLLSPVLKTS